MSQTLPAPVAIVASQLLYPVANVAVTSLVFRSIRDRVVSSQIGTQRLPKPATSPALGFFPTGMIAAMVLVFASRRTILLFRLSVTHTEPSASTVSSQSGHPPVSNTASGFRRSIGILTPGVSTPGP